MNKTLKIASLGAVALGFAVVPVSGAFAATSFDDTITAVINESCTVTKSSGAGTYSATIVNGKAKSDLAGSVLSVKCNSKAGWDLKAVGAGTATDKTQMVASGTGSGNIATGTATSGGTSNWAFKIAGTGASSSYTSFAKVPSTATSIASGTTTTDGSSFTVTYQIYMSPTQAAGTYTGKVTYTVSAKTS